MKFAAPFGCSNSRRQFGCLISSKGTFSRGVRCDNGSTERAIYSLNLFITDLIFFAVDRIKNIQLLAEYIDLRLQVAYHGFLCQLPVGAFCVLFLDRKS